jgi:hypothetical protein
MNRVPQRGQRITLPCHVSGMTSIRPHCKQAMIWAGIIKGLEPTKEGQDNASLAPGLAAPSGKPMPSASQENGAPVESRTLLAHYSDTMTFARTSLKSGCWLA